MSTRLAKGGRLIDRSAAQEFTFNGKRLQGFKGDTLAAALLAGCEDTAGRRAPVSGTVAGDAAGEASSLDAAEPAVGLV